MVIVDGSITVTVTGGRSMVVGVVVVTEGVVGAKHYILLSN